FPRLRTLDAYPGNLPAQRTTFVGRQRELGELREALHEAPVVTLNGVAGVGKTRLAIQAAALAVVDHPDGAWLIELAPIADGDDVAATVASTLQLRDRTEPVHAVAAALRQKRALLVLDNCEHIVDDVA